ncbi:hypothetical protein ACS5PN_24920 [Roseateles sp. NT4]|uniref:hypothetical protein n=1 Tax=Roseateles sp. NT4 TaxID=3453715 RepID=UPI003EEB9FDE
MINVFLNKIRTASKACLSALAITASFLTLAPSAAQAQQTQVIPAYSSVPANWVVTRLATSNSWEITNTTGFGTGTVLYVYFSSGFGAVAIPQGWGITQAGSTTNQITKLAGSPAWTVYYVTTDSPIPSGWVITDAGSSRNQITYVETVSDYTNVNVRYGSPIPADWVITQAGSTWNTITKVKNVPDRTEIGVTIGSPIPTGWVITTTGSAYNRITKIKGLPVGTEISVSFGSPLPLGWEVKIPGQQRQTIIRRF